ncbi:MAG: saccharopine dehydrogenase NADP-binding domain-containing protein [Chitinophagaceae bacterium]|nr:saccharopine dehydrogenase NADP-binding domain-containing protein [Chitinophagaceae bacterium]
MTNILVFGAGKSSSYLIKYLLDHAARHYWQITVADANLNAAVERVGRSDLGSAVQIDISDDKHRKRLIANANMVISLLPPALHIVVARDCLELRRNLVTASYVSDEIQALHRDARDAGLLFMNEIGLDPGIDHMSAMKIIHEVERLGGEIYSFKSYCGGLIAPESDNNPWHYKISWNPRNILMAGKAGADFRLTGFEKHLDYEQLFDDYETIQVPGLGPLAAYANRDSLSYLELYGLHDVKTMLRATLRYESYCIGWNAVVQLGLTDESKKYPLGEMTFHDWFMLASTLVEGQTPQDRIQTVSKKGSIAVDLIAWLGLFEKETIPGSGEKTSAEILLQVIEQKWALGEHDKDMIVMHHEFEYGRKNFDAKLHSSLIVTGTDKTYTAMAKTVGLPMAIFTRLFLSGKFKNLYGVQIPVMKEVYKPVLKELTEYGIDFVETFPS